MFRVNVSVVSSKTAVAFTSTLCPMNPGTVVEFVKETFPVACGTENKKVALTFFILDNSQKTAELYRQHFVLCFRIIEAFFFFLEVNMCILCKYENQLKPFKIQYFVLVNNI